MRLAYTIAILMLIIGTSTAFTADGTPPAAINGLERVPNSRVELAYVRPGTDWSKYRTIQLGALQIPPRVRDAAPQGTRPQHGESYVLRDKDVAALQEEYAKAMRSQLSKAGYTFVTAPGPDTLIVAAQIADIVLAAPIEGSRVGYAGRGTTFSAGAGAMSITAVFADGATGHVVAEVADRYYPANVWGINNSVSNRAQASQGFNKWGRELRERLTERGKPGG